MLAVTLRLTLPVAMTSAVVGTRDVGIAAGTGVAVDSSTVVSLKLALDGAYAYHVVSTVRIRWARR